jgi:thioredoxin 1
MEEKKKIKILDFSASWCQPCKMQKPILERVAANNSALLEVEYVDVEENPELANQYDIRSVPTLVYFVDGQQVEKTTGLMMEPKLKTILQKYLST